MKNWVVYALGALLCLSTTCVPAPKASVMQSLRVLEDSPSWRAAFGR